MGELIREQILLLTREEVPHSVAIAIEQVLEEESITRVFATIHVERDSQKGIVIGKKGAMAKEIGTAARAQMQKLIAGKVHSGAVCEGAAQVAAIAHPAGGARLSGGRRVILPGHEKCGSWITR